MSKTNERISKFISKKMKMSHIYQPVMLLELLKSGRSTAEDVGKAILQLDPTQIEYYKKITNEMPGRVLRNHKIVLKNRDEYSIRGFEDLRPQEVRDLNKLCQDELQSYIEKRGSRIWQHRKQSLGYISGSVKFEVMKRAKHRCEACYSKPDLGGLEADHINPKSKGGKDDIDNLQALCYRCNSRKRNLDNTDLRGIEEDYEKRDPTCDFCTLKEKEIVESSELAVAVRDIHAVTDSHTLIMPRRHTASYFDLGRPEINACNSLMENQKRFIEGKDSSVSGFNIGINEGVSAGQTIMHVHIHLIPRREGDVEDPRGGIRGIIPRKQKYP